jgi:hypothetical protein
MIYLPLTNLGGTGFVCLFLLSTAISPISQSGACVVRKFGEPLPREGDDVERRVVEDSGVGRLEEVGGQHPADSYQEHHQDA